MDPSHMNLLIVLSGVLGIVLFIPLCIQIILGKVEQNIASFILWGSADIIATASIIVQKGNFVLPLSYTIGSIATVLCILKSRNFKWTRFESVIATLVVVCVIFWFLAGPAYATILSSITLFIAGLPQLTDTFNNPWKTPVLIYTGYTVANVMSMIGAKSWSVEERFYPGTAAIYCALVVFFGLRKFWVKPKTHSELVSDLLSIQRQIKLISEEARMREELNKEIRDHAIDRNSWHEATRYDARRNEIFDYRGLIAQLCKKKSRIQKRLQKMT